MSLDMKKMRSKLENLQNRGSGERNTFWRPQEGEQTVRIVPTADGDPFKDFHFHYLEVDGKRQSVLCPKKNFGEKCPICNFATQLFQEGTPDSIKMAKTLFARQRFFSPVLVRGEEESGVRVWGYGKMAYESLLNLVLNPDYGDITDVDDGTDLNIHYGRPAGAQFPQTKIQPRRRTSTLCDEAVGGPERCAELLESIPDFDTLFERRTTEDVQAVLDEFMDSPEAGGETTKYAGTKTDTSNVTTASSVDRAFEELSSQLGVASGS